MVDDGGQIDEACRDAHSTAAVTPRHSPSENVAVAIRKIMLVKPS